MGFVKAYHSHLLGRSSRCLKRAVDFLVEIGDIDDRHGYMVLDQAGIATPADKNTASGPGIFQCTAQGLFACGFCYGNVAFQVSLSDNFPCGLSKGF